MKTLKQLAWGLPTVALATGAFALTLTGGVSGAMTGPDLPAPIESVVTAGGETATVVDGKDWEYMAAAKKIIPAPAPKVVAKAVAAKTYKGSYRD